jgi:predicted esterase
VIRVLESAGARLNCMWGIACRTLIVALVACLATAQDPVQVRYELGKRLQRLERALEENRGNKAAWVRARPHLEKAVGSFFGMSLDNAESAIDHALAAVTGAPHENELSADGQLSLSCMGRLERAVVPDDAGSAKLSAGRGYEVNTEALEVIRGYSDTHLLVYAVNDWGDLGEAKTNWGVSGMKFFFPDLKVLVDKLPPGDYRIAFRSDFTAMEASGKPAWTRRGVADSPRRMTYGFSVIKDLDHKLRRLAGRTTRKGSPVETQIAFLQQTIEKLVDGRPVETDAPANRLLDRALELAAINETGEDDPTSIFPVATRGGDHCLMMTVGEGSLPARLMLPEHLAENPVLVVALHGMGGSENLFMDGLGDGLAVKLARQRGWVLLSPRADAKATVLCEAIEQVRKVYGVPDGRVCVIGHSMGAVKAIELVQTPSFGFLAMAPIGGGGLVREPAPFRGKPVHVFTGSGDFAKGQCARLATDLAKAGAMSELHMETDIEHLAAVQWWLPEVFRFFDKHTK